MFKKQLFFILFLTFSCNKNIEVLSVSNLFSDGAILQRDTTVTVWGTSMPNNQIELTGSWGEEIITKSNSDGKWKGMMKTSHAGGPHSLRILSKNNELVINDILFGEVWLASGQSNMEMNFDYCCNSTDSSEYELSHANYPKLRMFNVKKAISDKPQIDIEGDWVSAVGKNIIDFSAVGYFFAKNLYLDLNVPIGIINASWGGSIIESWSSNEALSSIDGFTDKIEEVKISSENYRKTKDWYSNFNSVPVPSSPMDLFNDVAFPDIGYMDFILPNWEKLDYLGQNEIKNRSITLPSWLTLDSSHSITKFVKDSNFVGVALFKNHFYVEDNDLLSYQIEIKPDLNMPWGTWEYDIFVNGIEVASSLINLKGNNYLFEKIKKTFNLDVSSINKGENIIIIRTFGYSRLGEVSIRNSEQNNIPLLSNWQVKIIAEESYQIDNYIYPYTSYYMYSGNEVDYSAMPKKVHLTSNTTSALYNGMIHPLLDYGIKGVIWYQGESNIERGGPDFETYKEIFPLMIKDFRKSFGKNTPFYFAQIANYVYYGGMLKYFREVQQELSELDNTGMVVTFDIGENHDIHPSNKHDVGQRFALLALNKVYDKDVLKSGPDLYNVEGEGKFLNLYFRSTGSGLKIINNEETGMEIAGSDKIYFPAKVDIYKNFLQAFSDKVKYPKYIRYAWSDTAVATLFNKEGLPSAPFSTEISR
jgi:sialate O-acetylesterase